MTVGVGPHSIVPHLHEKQEGGVSDPQRFSFVMITQDDPMYVRIFFEEFLSKYRPLEALKCVVIAPAMGKKSFLTLVLQMYKFYGAWDFLRVGARFALLRLLDRLFKSGFRGHGFSIDGVCRAHGIRVEKWRDINSAESLGALQDLAPDLVVSVAAPQIFRKNLIALPPLGCVNIHNSKLPKYRGMMPNFWQMLHGEKEVGTSIHLINEGVDDGDILLQRMTPILPGESLDSLIRRTKRIGAELMVEALGLIRSGNPSRLPNATEDSSYFSFPSAMDVRQFRKKGYRLL